MNMFGNLGGALSPVVVGHCVQALAQTNPWAAWHLPILSTAAGYLLSLGCWLAIDTSQPIPESESDFPKAANKN